MSHGRIKILVTGGAGYIGSHTCISLQEKGYDPVIADNFSNSGEDIPDRIASITGKRPETHFIDLTDRQSSLAFFKKNQFAGVIHFAALKSVGDSVKDPIEYYRNNLGSTLSVLEGMKISGCRRLIFSSSCTVYGTPDTLPVTESAPFKPAASPYGATKQMCEQIIRKVSETENIRSVALRYFNPIGAHPSSKLGEFPKGTPNNLMPYLTGAVAGKLPPLKIFGTDYNTPDGTCIRDYIHVCDLAEAHVAALEADEDQTAFTAINIGTGRGYSVKEITDAFSRVNQVDVPQENSERRPGDIEQIWAETSFSEKFLGWKTKRSLEEMLKDAWNWEKNLNSMS